MLIQGESFPGWLESNLGGTVPFNSPDKSILFWVKIFNQYPFYFPMEIYGNLLTSA